MPEWNNRAKESRVGKFYVDIDECIACENCIIEAPNCFKINDDGFSYIIKQPINEIEEDNCYSAMEFCPVSAIGADGEDEELEFKKYAQI